MVIQEAVAVQPVEVPAYNVQVSGNGEKQGDVKRGKMLEKESTEKRGEEQEKESTKEEKVEEVHTIRGDTNDAHTSSQKPTDNECMIMPTSIKVQRWHVKIHILRFGLIRLVLIFTGLQRWHVKMAFPKGR